MHSFSVSFDLLKRIKKTPFISAIVYDEGVWKWYGMATKQVPTAAASTPFTMERLESAHNAKRRTLTGLRASVCGTAGEIRRERHVFRDQVSTLTGPHPTEFVSVSTNSIRCLRMGEKSTHWPFAVFVYGVMVTV